MSHKVLGILALALTLLTGSAAAAALRPHTVWGGKISLLVSDALAPMPASLLSRAYPAPYQPTEVLCNPTGSVVLAIEHTKAHTQSNIGIVRSSMSGVFHQTHPGATWIQDDVTKINGRPFAVFELVTRPTAKAPGMHQLVYVTELSGTLLLVTFRAEEQDAPQWIATGRAMLNSLTLRD